MKLNDQTLTELIEAFLQYDVRSTDEMHEFAHKTGSGISGSDISRAHDDAFVEFFKNLREQMAEVLDRK